MNSFKEQDWGDFMKNLDSSGPTNQAGTNESWRTFLTKLDNERRAAADARSLVLPRQTLAEHYQIKAILQPQISHQTIEPEPEVKSEPEPLISEPTKAEVLSDFELIYKQDAIGHVIGAIGKRFGHTPPGPKFSQA